MSQRLFCLQLIKKIVRFWPVTLLVNLGPTWLITQTGAAGPIMTFLTWALFPPMLLVCEVFFLLLGTLAEIPAELLTDALFPRLPGKDTPPEELDNMGNDDSLWAVLPKNCRAGILILLAVSLTIGGLLLVKGLIQYIVSVLIVAKYYYTTPYQLLGLVMLAVEKHMLKKQLSH